MAKTNFQDEEILSAEDMNALGREINELSAELYPLGLTLSISPTDLKEKGSGATAVTLGWVGKIKGVEVKLEAVKVNGTEVTAEQLSAKQITDSVTDSKTYSVEATAQGRSASGSKAVTYVYPIYIFFATAEEAAKVTLTGKQALATSLIFNKTLTNGEGGDAYLWIVSGYTPTTVQSEDGLVIAIGGSVRTTANGLKYWRSTDKLASGNWVLTIKS